MKKTLLLTFTLLTSLLINSQTSISGGTVSGNWTLSSSPYLIQGSIMVPNGSTLTIEPGVTVNFQGHYKLLVLGQLLAQGTNNANIVFTAASTSTGWYGIRFDNTSSTNDTSRISYCDIQYGKANGIGLDASGGAIMLNNFSKVNITNCRIKNIYGGGIYCFNSSPSISNNSITFCEGGGIIFDNNSNPQVTFNNISNNIGVGIKWDGGNNNVKIQNNNITYNTENGIFCSYSYAKISNNTISHNNTSNNRAGGIWCTMGGVIISNNLISYNTGSSGYSGGIFCYPCNALISSNFICNNSGTDSGGGLCFVGDTTSIVFNNVIANNNAISGGAIFFNNSSPTFINNTIANNKSTNGGGLNCWNTSNPKFNNCIFYGNTASANGTQIYLSDEASDPDFHYCNIQGGIGSFELNGNFYTGTSNNILDADPLFTLPSSGSGIDYNGTIANWALQSSSSSINTGNPSGLYSLTDIVGNPRIQGTAIDMGAYEFQTLTSITDLSWTHELSIFPNPFNDRSTIKLTVKMQNCSLNIYNLFGQKIKVFSNISDDEIIIDRSNLPSGIYFAQLIQNNDVIALKKFTITD